MQLLVTLTAAIGLASTTLALRIPDADIPSAPGALARRAAAKCTFTYTITESYGRTGKVATKTVFKKVGSKPTAISCGRKSTCNVAVKTITIGKPVRVVYGQSTVVDLPYCSQPAAKNVAAEEEEEEE
ncbi:uncharacterized protein DFL_008345 [Arthrobotrys flagrans]|uniref:Uncharacterized protein n=1 Tax=Arthrobotrys flagrans TaxID=97331 RepID=A0A436ZNG7_ARTFL|nr:hypothetical protein DFL_008345 [Arthrobotrys flagrans]